VTLAKGALADTSDNRAEKNPADLKAVCITNGDAVQKKIADTCGDSEQAALKWFADTCDAAGHKVGMFS
jgi:hypothetical protein